MAGIRHKGTCVVKIGDSQCRGYAVYGFGRCWPHLNEEERAEQRKQGDEVWDRYMALAKPHGFCWPHDDPACWYWPLEELLSTEKCAICNKSGSHLVEDHDHETGLVRGWLCRSCNLREGINRDLPPYFEKYRRRNPYSMLGIEYPYTGYGWINGKRCGE